MAPDYQHCPTCDEEYVAGVTSCAECGGPLLPGPRERLAQGGRRRPPPSATADGGAEPEPPDRLLARMPGLQADHAVRTLLLEGVTCRVECSGIEKVYRPGQPPAEPFAVTLPVSVYVSGAQHDTAQEILESLEHDDVIGDQWSDSEQEEHDSPAAARPAVSGDLASADDSAQGGYAAEGTSVRTAVLILLAALVLLFLFGR